MKKLNIVILTILSAYIFFCLPLLSQEYKYHLLAPTATYGEKSYSEYFWKGNIQDFKKFCIDEAQKALEKNYGKSATELLMVSQDIKNEEELKNNIYIRINISRMQLSYELLGTENFQYALRTTGGIEFFNVKTGEVYFSKIYTIIQPKQIIKKKNDPLKETSKQEFYDLFKNNIRELYDYLFSKAKDEYKPGIVKANIVKTLSAFSPNKTGVLEAKYIINKGRLQGIAERQQYRFSNSNNYPDGIKVRVSELQDNYSIVSIISQKSISVKDGEEIYRSGGAEISAKFPVRMMVSGTEILDNTQIDSHYQVDPGFITQIVHDNFSDNSSFQMLPYGSIAEQQLEATKAGEKEEEVIGNRQKPDVYIKCIISKAYVYSTAYNGGEFLKLIVSPMLIFFDANLGNVLYTAFHEEQSLQVIKENDRIANINEQFEILTKNAIYEITKKAKEEFKISQVMGSISAVTGKDVDIKIESGKLSSGNVFRVFKKGDKVIDPLSNKDLGYLLTYNGNIKVKEASGLNGKSGVLFSTESMSAGDVIRANSDNIVKGSIIIQAGETNIHTDKGEAYTKLSARAAILNTLRSLVSSGKFVVIMPQVDLDKLAAEKNILEPAGHFKTGETDKTILEPQVKVNSEVISFPSEIKSENDVKINVGLKFIALDPKTNKEIFKKGQKQTLPLESENGKEKVKVGLSEKDHPKYYIDMCYSLGLNLSSILYEELQKTLK